MPEPRERPHDTRKSLLFIGALFAALAVLGGMIAASPGGAMGFLRSVEGGNTLSISVLALVLGIVFILLHRLGMSFGSAEQIDRVNAQHSEI